MSFTRMILPTLVLGGAAALLLATAGPAIGYVTIGTSQSLSLRDFRVYNNFTDTTANNNTTPDPMFPGHTGAVLAIWKSAVEWGSLAHGDGSGDPTQPILGSGGANFDASFQGLANGVGLINDNIVSQISGCSGGTLAYTEWPAGFSGWRIRFYQCHDWDDGPGSVGLRDDLQSVSTHEYGHALGLDHPGVSGATMFATYNGGTGERSIASDDIAGIKAIYGVASASKPVITGHSLYNNQLTIDGQNFSPSGNEVWFTQAGSGGNGTPIKVTNLPSTGVSLTVTVPVQAGHGDILVRSNGTAYANLSNAWPFDPTIESCPSPTTYCIGMPNSADFNGAVIGWAGGGASVAANDLFLTCSGLPPGDFGIFFYGALTNLLPFGDGFLCIDGTGTGGLFRILPPQQVDIFGTVQRHLDYNETPMDVGNGQILPGSTFNFQFWYRDGPGHFNLSNALEVTFCP